MPLLRRMKRGNNNNKAKLRHFSRELTDTEQKRALFLRCSGMHTKAVEDVLRSICNGTMNDPGVAFVAPALYEGIPEFLDKIMDALADLATYSALYLGVIGAAAFSIFFPNYDVSEFVNGMVASTLLHSMVISASVAFRFAAIGHLRDSDKLMFLYRARYFVIVIYIAFCVAAASAAEMIFNVGFQVMRGGSPCFVDPTMSFDLWWSQWVDPTLIPKGQGIVYPKGEKILNPWIRKMNELNISSPTDSSDLYLYASSDATLIDQYSEFMQDHFDLAQPCAVQGLLRYQNGGGFYGYNYIDVFHYIYLAIFLLIGITITFWIAPARHIFNYWVTDRTKQSALRYYALGFLGWFSFHFWGPLAMHKDKTGKYKDPYDMTEAWEDYKVRRAYALEMAKKDKNDDGFVKLDELDDGLGRISNVSNVLNGSVSNILNEDDTTATKDSRLVSFLKSIGLETLHEKFKAAQLDIGALESLASNDASCCMALLEKAGVASLGQQLDIVAALLEGSDDGGRFVVADSRL